MTIFIFRLIDIKSFKVFWKKFLNHRISIQMSIDLKFSIFTNPQLYIVTRPISVTIGNSNLFTSNLQSKQCKPQNKFSSKKSGWCHRKVLLWRVFSLLQRQNNKFHKMGTAKTSCLLNILATLLRSYVIIFLSLPN